MANRTGRKPPNFTEEQADVLRKLAKQYRDVNGFSQGELAAKIGVEQQAISVLERGGGISYVNATRLAELRGFDGVDELFREHGVELGKKFEITPMKNPVANDKRNFAIALARRQNISEKAIREVNEEVGEQELASAKWMDRYQSRQRALDSARDTALAKKQQR